jgi:hypothetical protein
MFLRRILDFLGLSELAAALHVAEPEQRPCPFCTRPVYPGVCGPSGGRRTFFHSLPPCRGILRVPHAEWVASVERGAPSSSAAGDGETAPGDWTEKESA